MEPRASTIHPVKPGSGIDQCDIDQRKAFLEFGDPDAARLRELGARLRGAFPRFIDAFYDHLLAFEATRPHLADDATVARLKRFHTEYFERLTSGTYDQAYVMNRLQVGTVHHRIGLEPKWYLGAYSRYLTGFLPTIIETGHESRHTIETLSAFIKIVFLDISLALDTYIEADRQAIAALKDDAQESGQRFHDLVQSLDGIVWEANAETGRFLFVSQRAVAILGYQPERLMSEPGLWLTCIHPDDRESAQAQWSAARHEGRDHEFEYRAVADDGRTIWLQDIVRVVRDTAGRPRVLRGLTLDISQRKGAEETIRHMAYYDPLTGLPNRTLFCDRLSQVLARARWRGTPVAVLFIDLDRFKLINDGFGHDVGDRLLRAVAERLAASVHDGDTVARLGGDEFTVLLPELRKIEDLSLVTERLFAALKQPFVINDLELFVTASIGVSSSPTDGHDTATLLKNADAAMYQAKEQGRNTCRLYSPDLNAKAGERLAMEARLRRAIEHGQLLLHYQPIVDVSTGTVTGAEALVRLKDADGGHISPAQFIPLAEETGLIVAMGECILLTACTQAQAWRTAGFPNLRVSVNLSSRQFKHSDMIATVTGALIKTGLDPEGLNLELTESLLMQDTDTTVATLRRLAEMRILLSVDDFGTGYSSLSYLKRFPLHTIKIDQSFVQDLTTDTNDAVIAPAIIAMAHALNMNTVAEGVETEAQLAFLRAHGCDAIQGYLFSRPLPPEEFTELLRSNRRLTG
jgi:diguanylate cyclase (GGDEF)-like protein/PAS domain S-box-containing protein